MYSMRTMVKNHFIQWSKWDRSKNKVFDRRNECSFCRRFPVSDGLLDSQVFLSRILVEEILNNYKWWLLMINIILSSDCTVSPVLNAALQKVSGWAFWGAELEDLVCKLSALTGLPGESQEGSRQTWLSIRRIKCCVTSASFTFMFMRV